jgi:hypothetical protein
MNELKRLAKLNEDIKCVLTIAEDISLIAVNAMLVARQAGDRAVGFGVATRELRSTSDRMATAMLSLASLTCQLVFAAARGRSLARRIATLSTAGKGGAQAGTLIAPACSRRQNELSDCATSIKALVHQITGVIRSTGKQCASGMLITRCATIEAAYGGTMQPLLSQISQRFEASIAALSAYIHALQEQLKDYKA